MEHPREGDSSILLRHVDKHVVHWAPQLAELLGAPRVVTSRDGHQFGRRSLTQSAGLAVLAQVTSQTVEESNHVDILKSGGCTKAALKVK